MVPGLVQVQLYAEGAAQPAHDGGGVPAYVEADSRTAWPVTSGAALSRNGRNPLHEGLLEHATLATAPVGRDLRRASRGLRRTF